MRERERQKEREREREHTKVREGSGLKRDGKTGEGKHKRTHTRAEQEKGTTGTTDYSKQRRDKERARMTWRLLRRSFRDGLGVTRGQGSADGGQERARGSSRKQ